VLGSGWKCFRRLREMSGDAAISAAGGESPSRLINKRIDAAFTIQALTILSPDRRNYGACAEDPQ
jgi:hypothetical protein